MSYDFWLTIDTGGPEPVSIEPHFNDRHPVLNTDGYAGNVLVTERGYVRSGNYTSNVSRIWSECLMSEEASHFDQRVVRLSDLDGELASNVAPLLDAAVTWGIAHLPELELLNPQNGWGDARGALTYLWDIQRMCEMHPKAILRLWY